MLPASGEKCGIGRLHPVADYMRQGRLDHLPGMVCLLSRPVPEGRAESVRHRRNPKLAQQAAHRAVVQRPPAPMGEHQRNGSPLQCLRLL